MQPVAVRELGAGHLAEAANVLGRGMRDNPLHVRAFGGDDDARREAVLARFFLPLLRQYLAKGAVLGAFDADRLVGVCGMVQPGRCQPTVAEKLRLLPSVVRAAPGSMLAIHRWTGEWARRDPARAHWHLGPVAVDREIQGRGIGSAMLTEFCRRVDALSAMAYLETDKPENVTFYERHAFEIMRQGPVLGMPNWFMIRRGKAGRRTLG
jgi:GNAT superfamily N-acetyltransferase